MLGDNPLWWCWPSVPAGNGLKFRLVNPQGEWHELHSHRDDDGGPWGENGFTEP